MRLKSYFSGTVEAAMERARRELGADALLVNARPATPETRSLGAFEVVFGVADSTGAVPRAAGGAAHPGPLLNTSQITGQAEALNIAQSVAHPAAARAAQSVALYAEGDRYASGDRLMQEVTDVKRQVERLGQSLRHPRVLPAVGTSEAALYARLLEAELEPALAEQAAQGTPLENLFEVDATLGRGSTPASPGTAKDRAVVALIGPPGAGKTTTLVKLAARFGLTSRRPAQILSIDVCRIGAADQLRTFASILGMGCEVVETPTALAQAIEEYRNKDYIFIDTPGYAGAEMEDARELAALFSAHAEIDTHLVLAASMKALDLARAADRYEMFFPRKLIFTRVDETASCGPLISESARRGWPVSFLAGGQDIPDDLEPATKERLTASVAGRETRSAGAAA